MWERGLLTAFSWPPHIDRHSPAGARPQHTLIHTHLQVPGLSTDLSDFPVVVGAAIASAGVTVPGWDSGQAVAPAGTVKAKASTASANGSGTAVQGVIVAPTQAALGCRTCLVSARMVAGLAEAALAEARAMADKVRLYS